MAVFTNDTFNERFVYDTFTGTTGVELSTRTGETGATWTLHPATPSVALNIEANRVRLNSAHAEAIYYASGVPDTADYEVVADNYTASAGAAFYAVLCGRLSTSANTAYQFRHSANTALQLFKWVAGVLTQLGSDVSQTATASVTYNMRLRMVGSSIKCFWDNVEKISVTDAAITAIGRGGIYLVGAATSTTGPHLDNFEVNEIVTLVSHVGETGATWTLATGTGASVVRNNKVCPDGTAAGIYTPSGVPAVADYDVEAAVAASATLTNAVAGVVGRYQVATTNRYEVVHDGGTIWQFYKYIGGAQTNLGSYTQTLTVNQAYALKLELRTAAKKVYIDSVERISSADDAITDAGLAGLYQQRLSTAIVGYTLDNFVATDTAAAPVGNLFTQEFVEAAYQSEPTPTNALVSQEFVEAAYQSEPDTTDALNSQEFVEAAYRDALAADAALVTQEFIELGNWAAENNPANAIRLTQQTVEILYLEPAADPTFNDCGQFGGLREWEVRIYDNHNPATGKRKAFGPDGYDLQQFVRELNFELQERGGYGGGACEFDALWNEVDLDGTERVDVYLWDAPAYRGYLRIAQKNLASPESASPHFYGMVALLDQWQVKRKYAYGCATDVVLIARDIALDYVQITGRFPSISLDMSTTVGATLKEFDGRGKSVAQCFNELADMAPNQTIWGAEMDAATPVPGDTLYFRPRPTAVAYVVPVGSNVEALVYPVDTHELTNSLKITGGDVAQPNLAPNGSFEEVMPASEDWGNLLIDADFEAGNSGGQWQLTGGSGSAPSFKQNGSAGAFGAGRSGQWWGELDTVGEELYQEVDIVAGRKYEAAVWCRLEQAGFSNSGTLYLEGRTSAGVLIVTVSVSLTGLTTTYKRFSVSLDLASYLTVAKLRYRVVGTTGTATNDGILIDDCGVYEYCAVAQQYWEVDTVGNATLTDLDWDYDGAVDARTGEYMVMVDAANIALSSDYVQIYNRVVHAPSVDANERYTLLVWWHTNGLGTPGADALSVGATSINSSGVQGTTFQTSTYSIAAGPPSTFAPATQCAQLAITTESTTAKLQLFVRVRTNTVVYIDDVMLVKGEIPEEVLSYRGYWTADQYERYIDVSDALLVGSYALASGVSASITTYGHHQAEVSNELVTDQASALAFAAGQFNAKALPKVEASLNIYGARKLIFNEGKVRIVNLPSNLAALWPARSSYTITGEAIICRVELGNQRPDLQALLQLTAERARS